MSTAVDPVARAAGADDRHFGAAMHSDQMSSSVNVNAYGAEKSLTPMTAMDGDWDGYRKHGYGPQPSSLGVLRNDRTPLNTPYTPQLVKLHLKRHDEYEQQQQEQSDREYAPAAKQFVSSIKSKLCILVHPVQKIRKVVDRVMELVLPQFVLQSRLFIRSRKWILWYFTTILSVPFALLLSPMVIAFCICTSPIWMAGVVVLVVRALVPAWNHPPLTEDCYVRKSSPSSKLNGHISRNGHSHSNNGNGIDHRHQYNNSSSTNGHHSQQHLRNGESSNHPNSMYRHANITTSDSEPHQDN